MLQTVHRQASDPTFVELLNELRAGECSQQTIDALAACSYAKKPPPTDGILATRLHCTNKDVDAENNARLRELKGLPSMFSAIDSFGEANPPAICSRLRGICRSFLTDCLWLQGTSPYQEDKLAELMEKKVAKGIMLKQGAQASSQCSIWRLIGPAICRTLLCGSLTVSDRLLVMTRWC